MPNPTLIIGGPGSGKTDAIISRLAALYEADPFAEAVALVPTVRHGDQFRRRLVDRCGVALGLRVETISRFSRGLASEVWVPSHALVEELLSRIVRREVEAGSAGYFRPISGTKGLGNLVRGAVGDLLAEGVEAQAFSEATAQFGSPSLVSLSAIYAAYIADLKQRGWVHPAQIGLTAAGAVRAGAPLPATIVLDGFHLFRGTELALLETLVAQADVTIALDPQAGVRSQHDYKRLLRLFPYPEVVELQGNGTATPSSVIADEAADRMGQLPLFPLEVGEEFEGDGAAGSPTVIKGEAADREGQLRAIARQIKQRLADEPSLRPSDFAVAFRQASPHLSLARQVFSEYDLPLDPAAGERLNSQPLGVWLRRLLHLARDGWRLRDVVSVLSSGFVDLGRWGLSRDRVASFAQKARENHLWSGQESLQRAADGVRVESEKPDTSDAQRRFLGQASTGMAAALEELRALLEQPPADTAEHARRLENALFGRNALIDAASRRDLGADVEMDALRGYLQDLVSTHEALGGEAEGFESFIARVEAKLEAPAVMRREAGGVLLAPMHTLNGLRFDFVAVGGLIAGEFPAPRASAGLLSGPAIAALNQAGLDLPPEPRLTEDELWESVSTRADRTLALWRTRLDDRGRPASASYYFPYYFPSEASQEVIEARAPLPERTSSRRELAIACTQQWASQGRLRPLGESAWPIVRLAANVESRRRSFSHGGLHEGQLSAGQVPWLTGADARWSASRIESYRTCSFQFFGNYGLRLRELEQEMDGADAATRGTVIHEVLGDALEPLIERGEPLTLSTVPEALDRLSANGREIWNSAPTRHGFGRAALWRVDADQTLPQLEALLWKEAERSQKLGVNRIIGAEKDIVASLPLDPPLQVVAKIDRLDAGDGLVVIVDYKSGRPISETEVLDGRRVQLQLYGYLGREEVQANRVIARYAWVRPNIKWWELDSSNDKSAAALNDIVEVAGGVRNAVDSGDFRVNPQIPDCPSYCAMRHICRVNQFSRWKTWD